MGALAALRDPLPFGARAGGMTAPSPRQRQVLRFIAQSIASRGVPPTYRELCDLLGVSSTNAVNDLLAALERKGLIRRDVMKSRAVVPTRAGWLEVVASFPVRVLKVGTVQLPDRCPRCHAETYTTACPFCRR